MASPEGGSYEGSSLAKPGLEPMPSLSCRADVALRGIYEISKVLSVPGRLDETLSQVLDLLTSFVALRRAAIAIIDEKGEALLVAGRGGLGPGAGLSVLPERAVGRVVTNKAPLIVDNVENDDDFAAWPVDSAGAGTADAVIAAPILDRGAPIGVLAIDRPSDASHRAAIDADARFLGMIANMIGQTLHLYDVVSRDRARLMEDQRRLEKESPRRTEASGEQGLIGIVGASRAIRAVFSQINVVARTHTTVLLRGESGTGKELFARATHDLSPRKDGPFIRLNCAALPENMLESELFGHEKGSFTGAIGQRKGRFELADKGTLFLDEIGEISPAFQAKLLRVLQEGEFERVGGSRTVKVDVRFVFATNRNLEAAVERGEFRADLYYRINVVPVVLPPLRERPDDVALLAQEFIRRFNEENGARKRLTQPALRLLQGCNFPGNVRELENCVRRTATLSRDDALAEGDFACTHGACLSSTLWKDFSPPPAARAADATPLPPESFSDMRSRRPAIAGNSHSDALRSRGARVPVHGRTSTGGAPDRESLIDAMEKAGWVQAKAARLLSVTPRQIAYALAKHQIPIKKF
jgi:Nif-specific regulatory protein